MLRRLPKPTSALVLALCVTGAVACTGEVTKTGPGSAATTPVGTAGTTGELPSSCSTTAPPSTLVRRLTRFEYNNTLRDLLQDTTQAATALPSEELGNGFSNDTRSQSVSSLLVAQYSVVAQGVAARATATPEALAKLLPCSSGVAADTEEACARSFIASFAPKAYRRALLDGEADQLLALEQSGRQNTSFAAGIATVIEAVLQSPEYLYKVEFGTPDAQRPDRRRPTGDEMATRLSYLFWGSLPDDALSAAARAGQLATADGVMKQATRLLEDPRAHSVVSFFFDNLLPINALTDLTRDKALFPAFSHSIGSLMHQETQRFLEYEIFEANGTWASALTAPYTFVNGPLAQYYGIAGVEGDAFQKVNLDTSQRLGVLLQAGVMAGTVTTNKSNPVLRGSFVLKKLLCRQLNLPTDPAILAMVKVPDDTSGATARDRFVKHSSNVVCSGCHSLMDPMGFTFENFDPVGQFRLQENGVTIDASGSIPGMEGTVNGPVEMVKKLAEDADVHACLASHWLEFAYGKTLQSDDTCVRDQLTTAFESSGHNLKQLLLQLTQTDAFLYLPAGQ